jgi:hypothetical protein
MSHSRRLGLALATAVVATCGMVGSASATLIDPASTTGAITSTNLSLAVSGGGAVSCTDTMGSAITPAAGAAATWKTIASPLAGASGCTAFGFVGVAVTPSTGCTTAATGPQLHVMGVNAATATGVITLLSGCSIDLAIPAVGCTLIIAGPQTVGNGTAGAGGYSWTNASPNVIHINSVTIPTIESNGLGAGCPTGGAHTGTLTGTFTRTSGTNMTVTP